MQDTNSHGSEKNLTFLNVLESDASVFLYFDFIQIQLTKNIKNVTFHMKLHTKRSIVNIVNFIIIVNINRSLLKKKI